MTGTVYVKKNIVHPELNVDKIWTSVPRPWSTEYCPFSFWWCSSAITGGKANLLNLKLFEFEPVGMCGVKHIDLSIDFLASFFVHVWNLMHDHLVKIFADGDCQRAWSTTWVKAVLWEKYAVWITIMRLPDRSKIWPFFWVKIFPLDLGEFILNKMALPIVVVAFRDWALTLPGSKWQNFLFVNFNGYYASTCINWINHRQGRWFSGDM